ncbi:sensor histidine kinase [uncultured Arcticibacterium sp.]|uniref:sensor histidine kinase n=1 Tax=uncultured Arcticibacterium sp. TaxID=2173042 RepID=UPI0030F66914
MEPNYLRSFLDAIMQVSTMATISYFNYFVLLPIVLKEKKNGKYVLGLIASLAFIVSVQIWLKRMIYMEASERAFSFLYSSKFIIQHAFSTVVIVTFVSLLRFLKDWFELDAKRKEIENEKLATELRFLKDQINPHFLFNTLNNLYYLAHTNSPNTKEVISKLSQMMRYMIYEANNELVPVSKEIEYIQNYIDLEKLRLEDDFPLELSIEGEYIGLSIAPLIFITFLENAFKHGTTHSNEGSWVKVKFKFEGEHCYYEVTNSKNENVSEGEKSGIGLKNTMRRLNLSYENQHRLDILEDDKTYQVKLDIDL